MKSVDIAHYEKATTIIHKYRKEGFLHPELLLETHINEKIANGKTMEQAIEELYNETQT